VISEPLKEKQLIELTRLFMLGVFPAMTAILFHHQFFRSVDFIPVCDVILVFANGALERTQFALIFLSHEEIIYLSYAVLQPERLSKRRR
jgi:hypothetical protein